MRVPSLIARADPRYWGIPARSAVVSAVVVLVAVVLASAGLAALLYRSLLAGADDAAAGRVHDIAADLHTEAVAALDGALLATDSRIALVQVADASGKVLQQSAAAPDTLVLAADRIATVPRSGITDGPLDDQDLRVAAQAVDGRDGRALVVVAADSDAVESTVLAVVVLLAIAAPITAAICAAVTFLLVRRSLRSVDAIRARVAEITSSGLAERVPVPPHRDEISALARTMNAMLARVESGHAAHQRFVGDASHELRSPLATLISALEVGVAHPDLLDADLASGTLLPEARRMQSLVDDLLLLARADERGLPLRHDDVDLDDLAADEIARLRKVTRLDVRADLAPARVTGDRDGLARVLRNLADNAARHAASRVEIAVRPDRGGALVVVADDGPGIAPADRPRVFERFVRLDSGRSRAAGGTGLGLAIVAEVVAAHHGEVRIDERPGGGARVTVQLPTAPESRR